MFILQLTNIIAYFSQKTQIILLNKEKITMFIEYLNFTNIWLFDFIAKLLK